MVTVSLGQATSAFRPQCDSARNISPKHTALAIALLVVALLLIYTLFPTNNYYWDGIGFSLDIEGLHPERVEKVGPPSIYYNPNHLLYNLTGYLIFTPLDLVFPQLRALDVLQGMSVAASIGTSVLVLLMLLRHTHNLRLSLLVTLLMSFSATWWKYSTDANAYVPSTFCLVAATFLLAGNLRARHIVAVGLLHAAAMLLHQIAIFFLPAVVLLLWRRKPRAIFLYGLASVLPVLIAYSAVWFQVLDRDWQPRLFLQWITSNGGDVFAYRSLLANVLETFRSFLRVFFGGRLSLGLAFIEFPWLLAPILILAVALAVLVAGIFRSRVTRSWLPSPFTSFLAAWAASFTLFLTFWLTEYPYYRLFCLPAAIMLIGIGLSRIKFHSRLDPLTAFLVFLVTFNFTFYIYPYSFPEATPPVKFAVDAGTVWDKDVLVLYKEFTCDNWIMRHFNEKTKWKRAHLDDQHGLTRQVSEAVNAGHSVWIDTTLLGHITRSPDHAIWLNTLANIDHRLGISNRKHHLEFVRLSLRSK